MEVRDLTELINFFSPETSSLKLSDNLPFSDDFRGEQKLTRLILKAKYVVEVTFYINFHYENENKRKKKRLIFSLFPYVSVCLTILLG